MCCVAYRKSNSFTERGRQASLEGVGYTANGKIEERRHRHVTNESRPRGGNHLCDMEEKTNYCVHIHMEEEDQERYDGILTPFTFLWRKHILMEETKTNYSVHIHMEEDQARYDGILTPFTYLWKY